MQRISKDKAIELICQELSKGVAKADILAQIVVICQCSKRTAERYYENAEITHIEAQKKINREINEQTIGKKKEAILEAIRDQKERLSILQERFKETSKIRRGKITSIDKDGNKEIIKVTIQDELKANQSLCQLDERISKAHGLELNKTENRNVDSQGNDVQQVIPSVILGMSKEEALKLINNNS